MTSNLTMTAVLLVMSVFSAVPAATEQKSVPPPIMHSSKVTSLKNLIGATEETIFSCVAVRNCASTIEAHFEGMIPLEPTVELHGSNGLNQAKSMFHASGCFHLSRMASATSTVWSNEFIQETELKRFWSNSNWNLEGNSGFNFLFDSLSAEWVEFAGRHGVIVLPYRPTEGPMLGGSAHAFAPAFACAGPSGRTLGFDFVAIAGVWRKRRHNSQ